MFETVFNEITWDIHGSAPFSPIDCYKNEVGPNFDNAYSALIEDLSRIGPASKNTVVLAFGEFGRTPKINPAGGRDHHPGCWTSLFAGGPIQGGRVVGASDEIGDAPKDRPVSTAEIAATVFQGLGDPARHRASRPAEPPPADRRPRRRADRRAVLMRSTDAEPVRSMIAHHLSRSHASAGRPCPARVSLAPLPASVVLDGPKVLAAHPRRGTRRRDRFVGDRTAIGDVPGRGSEGRGRHAPTGSSPRSATAGRGRRDGRRTRRPGCRSRCGTSPRRPISSFRNDVVPVLTRVGLQHGLVPRRGGGQERPATDPARLRPRARLRRPDPAGARPADRQDRARARACSS